jgi:cell division septal protein FtsQ
VRRIALVLVAVALTALAVYWFALRGSSTTTAEARPPRAVAQIGEGRQVVVVAADGTLMGTAPGKKSALPVLPLKERPKGDRVQGHVLEEVAVLAAAPKPLRRYIAGADYAKTGVTVEFDSGIQIRFGDDHQADQKWKAAASVLADPSVTRLGYVDVTAPTRPATGGEEHELPPAS